MTVTAPVAVSAMLELAVTAGGVLSSSVTVIDTIVGLPASSSPSETVYSNESVPVKPAFGAYVNEPSSLKVNAPCVGWLIRMGVKASPSASVSLPNRPRAAGTVSVPPSSTV